MAATCSPLDALHRELGARMVPFGGWEMPLAYPSGTLAEHLACRRDAAVFDVSHLGTVRVEGPGALARLQAVLTNDLTRIGPGRAQYTHLLDPSDASVVDDIIVWWLDGAADDPAGQVLDVMPNASNTVRVVEALSEGGRDGLGVVDTTPERALLAVQGPRARQRLAGVVPEAAAVRRFRVARVAWGAHTLVAAGTGYTGEDGVELAVPAAAAAQLWRAVLDAGVAPAGLGARDTLRLEAGLPLHGHELGPGITPLQAGLGWVVAWDKGDFRGRAALERERAEGVRRRLRGLVLDGRRPPREGQAVRRGDEGVGTVTSGNFSPVLGRGIGLALLAPDLDAGDAVHVDVRGTAVPATVVAPPFVRPEVPPPAPVAATDRAGKASGTAQERGR